MSYMRTPTVSYTLRLPVDLKRLIDTAAASGGVSTAALVTAACWKYLERVTPVSDAPIVETFSSVRSPSGWPAEPSKSSMDALRAICAGGFPLPTSSAFLEDTEPLPLCPHKEWAEDGEQYRCALAAGHKGKCKPGERV